MIYDAVIVGAGPGGVTAAVQCARLGMNVVLIDKTGRAGGLIANAFSIENYPGLETPVTGAAFTTRLEQFLKRFDISVCKETVGRIAPVEVKALWEVETDLRTLQCKGVIVACGTVPRLLPFLGRDEVEHQEALFYEVKPLLERFSSPNAVILGGGEASFDYALSIARTGGAATLLCRGNSPKVKGRLLRLVQGEPRIALRCNSELIRAKVVGDHRDIQLEIGQNTGKSGGCTTLATKRCDALLVAVGRMPVVQTLFDKSFSPLNCLTPAQGLFICGDGRLGTLGQVGIAVGDGLQAAQALLEQIERSV